MEIYHKFCKDKNIYKLSAKDAYGYTAMKLRQQKKPVNIPTASETNSKDYHKNIISKAYIESICFRKKLIPTDKVIIPENLKDTIYKLYVSGVLPMRFGGI